MTSPIPYVSSNYHTYLHSQIRITSHVPIDSMALVPGTPGIDEEFWMCDRIYRHEPTWCLNSRVITNGEQPEGT